MEFHAPKKVPLLLHRDVRSLSIIIASNVTSTKAVSHYFQEFILWDIDRIARCRTYFPAEICPFMMYYLDTV